MGELDWWDSKLIRSSKSRIEYIFEKLQQQYCTYLYIKIQTNFLHERYTIAFRKDYGKQKSRNKHYGSALLCVIMFAYHNLEETLAQSRGDVSTMNSFNVFLLFLKQ